MSNPAPDSSLYRAADPRLHLLQLLLPNCIDLLELLLPVCVCFQLLLPVCVCFSCCSPLASASTAAPRLHPPAVLEDSSPCLMFSNIFASSRSIELKYEGCVSLVYSRPMNIPLILLHTILMLRSSPRGLMTYM